MSCEQRDSRRQSTEGGLDVPGIPLMKPTVEKLEAMEQQRRASMQQRRASLVDLIPDWPALKHTEAKKEVETEILSL